MASMVKFAEARGAEWLCEQLMKMFPAGMEVLRDASSRTSRTCFFEKLITSMLTMAAFVTPSSRIRHAA